MKYRGSKVKDTPTELLLFEILQRLGTQVAPKESQYIGPWQIATVGIGRDHTASILLPADDAAALERIAAEAEERVA